MSYRSSMYVSPPQTVRIDAPNTATGGSGIAAINPVNPQYTRLTLLGMASVEFGGVVAAERLAVYFGSGSQIRALGRVGWGYVLVEEFHPSLFWQPFQHGWVTIGPGNNYGYTAHGLTLGPKAFVVSNGMTSDRTLGGGLALAEGQVLTTLHFYSTTHVECICTIVDYPEGPGSITSGYTIIDPK